MSKSPTPSRTNRAEPQPKKRNKQCKDGLPTEDRSIILSDKLRRWITYIGVDIHQYERALYDVYKGDKPRYYRYLTYTKADSNVLVDWIRDLNIFSTHSAVPEYAIGLDVASAAAVDALRLGTLSQEGSEKWILDMCCAPGGKFLAILSAIRRYSSGDHRWNLIGLDSTKRRLEVCKSLLKRENKDLCKISVSLLNCKGQEFAEFEGRSMIGRFDRILLDAECTHEGSLRSVLRTLTYWGAEALEKRFTLENAGKIVKIQRDLLRNAISLIKPGGIIIYSTCSLHDEQNELLVSNVIKEFDGIQLYPIPTNSCRCCSPLSNQVGSWPAVPSESILKQNCPERYFYNSESIPHCKNAKSPAAVRFDPLSPYSDGLFIACIIRKI